MSLFRIYLNTEEKQWKLTKDKNFIIDDFEEYLQDFSVVLYENGQLFKNSLYAELKIEAEQLNIQPKYFNAIKYVSITSNDKKYYYFVDRISWRSQKTIHLSLTMDCLNTFKIGTDYVFNSKTKINRQHKNRFYKIIKVTGIPASISGSFIQKNVNATIQIGIAGNMYEGKLTTFDDYSEETGVHTYSFIFINKDFNNYIINYVGVVTVTGEGFSFSFNVYGKTATPVRKIDYFDEEINAVLYKDNEEKYIEREGVLNQDWFLIYRSTNINPNDTELTAVDCFLVGSKRTRVIQNLESNIIYPENLSTELTYVIPQKYRDQYIQDITFTYYAGGDVGTYTLDTHVATGQYLAIKSYGTYMVLCIYFAPSNAVVIPCDYVVLNGDYQYYTTPDDVYSYFLRYRELPPLDNITQNPIQIISGQTVRVIASIDDIDKTDSKLIKIIKLPYIPDNFEIVDEETIRINNKWDVPQLENSSNFLLKLLDLNTKFNAPFDMNFNYLNKFESSEEDYNSLLRNDNNESKMFHSSFYQEKFVYDSFSFVFELEKIDLKEVYFDISEITTPVEFVMTSTINSKFLFSYSNYILSDLGGQDYDHVLNIARNNEIVLYNNAYINYIRNGFNYDVKSKTKDDTVAWLGFALSTIGAVASFASSGVTGGFGIASGIGFATSATMSFVNAVGGTVSREQSFQNKQQQLKAQSGSVYGSDDVDLMSFYAKNRAKVVTYKVSDKMRKAILDLFYYLGYRDNVLQVPQLDTRTRFNFIACEPVFDTYVNLSDEIIQNIKNLFAGGVTVIHHYENEWDIDQIYENRETSLEVL